jgi:hypothetical protein
MIAAALVPVDHFLIMTIYALLVSAFFGTLWRNEPRDRVRLFLKIFLALMIGGLALAWVMYPFPS